MPDSRLIHSDDGFDLGDFLAQDSLDAHFHRHGRAGAALAGPLQADPNGVILIYADQLDIAPVADCYARASVSGGSSVGGLVGHNSGSIETSYSTGSVSGDEDVGGIVGYNDGTVTQCYSTGVVKGNYAVGGLMGHNFLGDITNCYSTNVVNGIDSVGGLAGENSGHVTNCYSIGLVSGSGENVGGLVGWNGGNVTQCYSTGPTSGTNFVGGAVGYNGGDVTDCFSTGAVNGSEYVGGLVGSNNRGTVTQCYSTGAVRGTGSSVGGLVGSNNTPWGHEGVVSYSFWDTQTSGQATSFGGMGKTTAEMQTAKTFLDAGWDFVDETANGTEDIWWINERKDYPHLSWEAIPGN